MNKLSISLIVALILLTTLPMSAAAPANNISTPTHSASASPLLARLDEIKAIDKSTLDSERKKELRKEVKSIKSNLRELGGGIYLSVGAIIIIVLLLILLL